MIPMLPLILLIQVLVPIGALGFFGWLALRYVRARERGVGSLQESLPANELRKLEDVISSLQSDVQALRERQEFVERLLEKPRPQSDQST